MLLGILSDTHGKLPATAAAVELLKSKGCEYYIHCGDVGSEDVLDHLAGLRSAFVFGNNDFDRHVFQTYARALGIVCLGTHGTLELGGRRVAVTHGDDPGLMRALLAGNPDYLLTGHSHVSHDSRHHQTRLINPGALYRASVKSVATLDLATDQLAFHTLSL
jgi:putative phosphoesterase